MSELYVKRQKLTSEIRRTQIQKYIATCRAAFDNYTTQNEEHNVQIDLHPYKQYMDDRNYSDESLLWFLSKINQLDIRRIEGCHLLVQMRRVLLHFSDQEYLQNGIKVANSILAKIIGEANQNPTFLNNSFNQLIELISQQKLLMFQVWQKVALLKSQLHFHRFFKNFIKFIGQIQGDLLQYLFNILKTLNHFTFVPSQKNSQAKLQMLDYFEIMKAVKLILENYTLGNQEMKIAALLCQNIFHQNSKSTYQILLLPEIVPFFIKSIDQHQQTSQLYSSDTVQQILGFVSIALGSDQKILAEIVNAYPKIFRVISQKLPVKKTFKTVNFSRPIKWTHQFKLITAYSVSAFANLACKNDYKYQIISTQIIKQIIELSAYPSEMVKNEVVFTFWNLLINSDQHEVQLICQKDIFWAIRNLLELTNQQSLLYCIKCLCHILKVSQNFPPNRLVWHYNSTGIYQEMERNGSIKILEVLVVNNCKQISQQAEKCLNLIKIDKHI